MAAVSSGIQKEQIISAAFGLVTVEATKGVMVKQQLQNVFTHPCAAWNFCGMVTRTISLGQLRRNHTCRFRHRIPRGLPALESIANNCRFRARRQVALAIVFKALKAACPELRRIRLMSHLCL